jgi:hypothetical protein
MLAVAEWLSLQAINTVSNFKALQFRPAQPGHPGAVDQAEG